MAEKWIFAVADDLTGALEVGARFAGSVVTTRLTVATRPAPFVLAVDTETRHLAPEVAAAIVHKTVLSALQFEPWLVYKKTDSTLRGNIAAEFQALLTAMPGRSLIYAPAYPEMGRTVKNGHLLVHGIPVHQSAFATDTLNPVRASDLRKMLSGVSVTVLDGGSAADIEAIAWEISQQSEPPIVAGPAAFASALAACMPSKGIAIPSLPTLTRCLVVNGSTHPASAQQIEFAHTHGCFDNDWVYFAGSPEGTGLERAASTGEYVRRILNESRFDALMVFGGDTGFGIHRALGAPDLQPYCEIAPGVPLSRSGDLFWITKAGGFGPVDLLCEIWSRLK